MTTTKSLLQLLLMSLILLTGCSKKPKKLKLAAGKPKLSYYDAAQTIKKLSAVDKKFDIAIIEEHQTWEGKAIQLNSYTNCRLLAEKKVDLAIAQNDITLSSSDEVDTLRNKIGLKTVLPLYPELFFILYRSEEPITSLHDLIANKQVAIGPKRSGTATLSTRFFDHFGIDTTHFTPRYNSLSKCTFTDSVDVICLVTSVDNPRITQLLNQGARIFQPSCDVTIPGGSPLDGFAQWYPYVRPYVLPQHFYGTEPEEAVQTIAVDAVLLCRSDLSENQVYDLVETLFDNRYLRDRTKSMPLFLQDMDSRDHSIFQFPLHSGTIRYLERNNPTFIERYSEVIALLITILFALGSGLLGLRRWRIHTQKERIDTFYFEALDIKKDVEKEKSFTKLLNLKQQLVKLEDRAYQLLTSEKLTADESFSILTKMLSDIEKHLREKLE